MLEVRNLSYHYQNQLLFSSVNLSASCGDVSVILGASGSGKTTLFKIIAGLVPHTGDCVLWKNKPLPPYCASYMPQKAFLLPWRCIWKNMWLMYELDKKTRRREEFRYRLDSVIHYFQLTPLLSKFPDELSEGQKQRVALAMHCLSKKRILLLDEPFSSLDLIVKEDLYAYVRSLAKKDNKAILLITHDVRDVLFLGDACFAIRDQTMQRIIIPTAIRNEALNNMQAFTNLFKTYISR